jgi:hypothetical protein
MAFNKGLILNYIIFIPITIIFIFFSTTVLNNNFIINANGQIKLIIDDSLYQQNTLSIIPTNNPNISNDNSTLTPPSLFNFSSIDRCVFALQPTIDCYTAFQNINYGVKVFYPKTWIVTHKDEKVFPYTKYNIESFMVNFTEPNSTTKVIVGNDILKSSFSLSSYLAQIIQNYRSIYQDFTLLSSDIDSSPHVNSIQLAGQPAYNIIYTYIDNPIPYRNNPITYLVNEIGIIIPNTELVYYLSYSAPLEYYSQYEQFMQPIRDSLLIKLNTPTVSSNIESQLQEYDRGIIFDDGLI